MDPNQVWAELRKQSTAIVANAQSSEDATSMAESFLSLDEWAQRGGFAPEAFERQPCDCERTAAARARETKRRKREKRTESNVVQLALPGLAVERAA